MNVCFVLEQPVHAASGGMESLDRFKEMMRDHELSRVSESGDNTGYKKVKKKIVKRETDEAWGKQKVTGTTAVKETQTRHFINLTCCMLRQYTPHYAREVLRCWTAACDQACAGCEEAAGSSDVFIHNDTGAYDANEQISLLFQQPIDWHEDGTATTPELCTAPPPPAVVAPEVTVVAPAPAAPSTSPAAPQRLDSSRSVLSVTTAAEDVAMDRELDRLVNLAPATPPNPLRAESKLTHAASFEDATLAGRVSKEDDYALPVLSEAEKARYGNFWQRYRSTSSVSLAESDGGTDRASPGTPSPATPTPSPATLLTALTATQLATGGPTATTAETLPATAEELANAGRPTVPTPTTLPATAAPATAVPVPLEARLTVPTPTAAEPDSSDFYVACSSNSTRASSSGGEPNSSSDSACASSTCANTSAGEPDSSDYFYVACTSSTRANSSGGEPDSSDFYVACTSKTFYVACTSSTRASSGGDEPDSSDFYVACTSNTFYVACASSTCASSSGGEPDSSDFYVACANKTFYVACTSSTGASSSGGEPGSSDFYVACTSNTFYLACASSTCASSSGGEPNSSDFYVACASNTFYLACASSTCASSSGGEPNSSDFYVACANNTFYVACTSSTRASRSGGEPDSSDFYVACASNTLASSSGGEPDSSDFYVACASNTLASSSGGESPPAPPSAATATVPSTPPADDAMTSLLATVLAQTLQNGSSLSAEQIQMLQGTMSQLLNASAAEKAAAPTAEQQQQQQVAGEAPGQTVSANPLPAAAQVASEAPGPAVSANPPLALVQAQPLPKGASAVAAAGDVAPPSSLPPPAPGAPPPPAAPIKLEVNSSTHPKEYRAFGRFCETSKGADEMKKVWVQGGPRRMAVFAQFVASGCDPLAMEAALRFKRQREEEDRDEGEYYRWSDILAFHSNDADKALAFITRRRAEPRGTSTDRNDSTVETFLYYNRQKRSVVNRTLDEIAVELGVSPSYAASVAAMLDGQNGPAALTAPTTALPAPASTSGSPSVPDSPLESAAAAKASAKAGAKNKANDGSQQSNPKKQRLPKPEGSELEVHVCTEDVGAFVANWCTAANSAQGQAVKLCGEFLGVFCFDPAYCSRERNQNPVR
ncbi:unnamed protein product [Symbiodinium sp. CCMP2592]|nr:unnamed protein product [Symbiodinium sp. CCMP2592]